MNRNIPAHLATSSIPAIRTESLHKKVTSPEGELAILIDINISIAAGEAIAIVGASGAGKSTLLALLAGLDTPSQGQVWLAGHDLFALDEDARARLRGQCVGFVFQSFHLLPGLNALENVMLPLELSGRDNAAAIARDTLARVGLGARMHHYPRQLSGGEQQRVAIARAYATQPAILFADEPTGNLDQRSGEHVIELMLALKRERGTTLVLVTHDTHLAARCDRSIALDAGRQVGAV